MTQAQGPEYLIFGTGALGSVLAGFLQSIGCPVTLVGRGAHFGSLQVNGLKVTGIWGERYIPPDSIKGFSDPSKIDKQFSIILLCVKSKDTDSAARQAAALLKDDGIMISIQNGLNNWETIARHVGKSRTVGARVIFGAEIPSPGMARVTVNADDVLLGEPFVPTNKLFLHTLEDDLKRSGIPVRTVSPEEIWAALWGKVLYNCSLNPLGALLEVPYGALGKNKETRDIIRQVLREIFAVMERKGVKVPFQNADDYYDYLMQRQLPPTIYHRASMLQDIENGRLTEIDALNGAISQYAKEIGISTPYNDLLTALIKFKEKPENREGFK